MSSAPRPVVPPQPYARPAPAGYAAPRPQAGPYTPAPHLASPKGLAQATLVLGRASSRMYFKAESLEEIRIAATAMMVSDLVDIVAAVAAALFVRRLTALQNEKAHQGPLVPYPVPVSP